MRSSPGRAPALLHLRQEAGIAPLHASWTIRAGQGLAHRAVTTALVGVLKAPIAGRLVAAYTLGGWLRQDLSIVGTGREQIICARRGGSTEYVLKVVIAASSDDPYELEPLCAAITRDEQVMADALGPYLLSTRYSIEPVDRRGRRYAIVGEQRRVAIVDSLFHFGGRLSELAQALPAGVRDEIAKRCERYRDSTGCMVDVLGIGNFVFVEGLDHPVLIDTMPVRPHVLALANGDQGTLGSEIGRRLDLLRAG